MQQLWDALVTATLPYISIVVGIVATAGIAWLRQWLLVRGVVVAAVETEKASNGSLSGPEKKKAAMGMAKNTLLSMTISSERHEKLMENVGVPAANKYRESITPVPPK